MTNPTSSSNFMCKSVVTLLLLVAFLLPSVTSASLLSDTELLECTKALVNNDQNGDGILTFDEFLLLCEHEAHKTPMQLFDTESEVHHLFADRSSGVLLELEQTFVVIRKYQEQNAGYDLDEGLDISSAKNFYQASEIQKAAIEFLCEETRGIIDEVLERQAAIADAKGVVTTRGGPFVGEEESSKFGLVHAKQGGNGGGRPKRNETSPGEVGDGNGDGRPKGNETSSDEVGDGNGDGDGDGDGRPKRNETSSDEVGGGGDHGGGHNGKDGNNTLKIKSGFVVSNTQGITAEGVEGEWLESLTQAFQDAIADEGFVALILEKLSQLDQNEGDSNSSEFLQEVDGGRRFLVYTGFKRVLRHANPQKSRSLQAIDIDAESTEITKVKDTSCPESASNFSASCQTVHVGYEVVSDGSIRRKILYSAIVNATGEWIDGGNLQNRLPGDSPFTIQGAKLVRGRKPLLVNSNFLISSPGGKTADELKGSSDLEPLTNALKKLVKKVAADLGATETTSEEESFGEDDSKGNHSDTGGHRPNGNNTAAGNPGGPNANDPGGSNDERPGENANAGGGGPMGNVTQGGPSGGTPGQGGPGNSHGMGNGENATSGPGSGNMTQGGGPHGGGPGTDPGGPPNGSGPGSNGMGPGGGSNSTGGAGAMGNLTEGGSHQGGGPQGGGPGGGAEGQGPGSDGSNFTGNPGGPNGNGPGINCTGPANCVGGPGATGNMTQGGGPQGNGGAQGGGPGGGPAGGPGSNVGNLTGNQEGPNNISSGMGPGDGSNPNGGPGVLGNTTEGGGPQGGGSQGAGGGPDGPGPGGLGSSDGNLTANPSGLNGNGPGSNGMGPGDSSSPPPGGPGDMGNVTQGGGPSGGGPSGGGPSGGPQGEGGPGGNDGNVTGTPGGPNGGGPGGMQGGGPQGGGMQGGMDPAVGNGGQNSEGRKLNRRETEMTGTSRGLQGGRNFSDVGFDTESVQIYDMKDTPCSTSVAEVTKQEGESEDKCITVFGKYRVYADEDTQLETVYDGFRTATQDSIENGSLEAVLEETESNVTFEVKGVSPVVDDSFDAFAEIESDEATSPIPTPNESGAPIASPGTGTQSSPTNETDSTGTDGTEGQTGNGDSSGCRCGRYVTSSLFVAATSVFGAVAMFSLFC